MMEIIQLVHSHKFCGSTAHMAHARMRVSIKKRQMLPRIYISNKLNIWEIKFVKCDSHTLNL